MYREENQTGSRARMYWSRLLLTSGLVLTAGVLSSCAGNPGSPQSFEKEVSKGTVLAKIGDVELHDGYLDLLVRVNPQLKARLDSPVGKGKLLEALADQELLYRAGVDASLGKDPQVLEKMALYSRIIVGQSYIDRELDKRVTAYYEEHKKDEFEQMHLADLFVKFDDTPPPPAAPKGKKEADKPPVKNTRTKAEAAAIAKRLHEELKAGKDFTELAKANSDDKLSAPKGGDMGWVSRTEVRVVRKNWTPILEKGFAMKAGEVSEPIETANGFHLVKVLEESRSASFADVEEKIRGKLGKTVKKDVLDLLKKDATLVYTEAAGVPPAGQQGPAAPHMPGHAPHDGHNHPPMMNSAPPAATSTPPPATSPHSEGQPAEKVPQADKPR